MAVLVRFCVVPLLYVPVAVNCCLAPAAMEELAGVTAIETSGGAIPVPLSVAVCGLEVPLSTIVSVPVRAPRAAGVKDTEIKQLAPALGALKAAPGCIGSRTFRCQTLIALGARQAALVGLGLRTAHALQPAA